MWSSNFLVEVAMKFGVLLAVLWNEARKSPRNCKLFGIYLHVLSMPKNCIEKENRQINFLEVVCTLVHPPFMQLDSHL